MSLWYESLGMALYDCGDNAAEKAKYILAYLSMPVPRSWWEKALQTGDVRNWAPILSDLQLELSKSIDFPEQLNASLLVALAFIDDEPQNSSRRFENTASNYTPDEYLDKAKRVLAKRPELARVGDLIEKAIEQEDQSSGS
jgi:hypothetical protein